MQSEQTFCILKPGFLFDYDAILNLFSENNFKIIKKTKPILLTRELIEKIYIEHVNENYFESHCEYMISGKVIMFILEGNNIIEELRKLMYEIIRPTFGIDKTKNVLHASDSHDSFERESAIVNEYFMID